MSIVRFDPLRSFEAIAKRFGELTDEFEKGVNVEFGGFAPRVDISEDETKVYIHAEMPGLKKENVKVSISDDNVLQIKGEKIREEKTENNEKTFIRMERNFGSFSRSFILPENVKTDSIDAKFENGILEIMIDKAEPAKPKEVEIKIK